MKAKAGNAQQPVPSAARPAPSATSNISNIPGLDQADLQRRIAEAKARIAGAGQASSGNMGQQRLRGGLSAAPPPLGLDKSGNIDLKAMLDQGIIPKRDFATAKVCIVCFFKRVGQIVFLIAFVLGKSKCSCLCVTNRFITSKPRCVSRSHQKV
jgi:hypothetical protein